VVELDLGFHPEAAVSGGLLIQSEYSVVLLFNAVSEQPQGSGLFDTAGVGMLEFQDCVTTRFGYPNDEGLEEHPLYSKGLAETGYAVCEVVNSRWAQEWTLMTKATADRIWEGRAGQRPSNGRTLRHFLASFHDSTFECVARDFSASVHEASWDAISQDVMRRAIANS